MHKVALIEDDNTMRSLLQTLLEFEGYQAVPIGNVAKPEEILDQLRYENPSLIFLDVHLQSMNGFDLVKRLRQDDALTLIPVLMTSGMELSVQSRRAGANDFILKPFMAEELLDKIRTTIGS